MVTAESCGKCSSRMNLLRRSPGPYSGLLETPPATLPVETALSPYWAAQPDVVVQDLAVEANTPPARPNLPLPHTVSSLPHLPPARQALLLATAVGAPAGHATCTEIQCGLAQAPNRQYLASVLYLL